MNEDDIFETVKLEINEFYLIKLDTAYWLTVMSI